MWSGVDAEVRISGQNDGNRGFGIFVKARLSGLSMEKDLPGRSILSSRLSGKAAAKLGMCSRIYPT
jgi:hypothetical protein